MGFHESYSDGTWLTIGKKGSKIGEPHGDCLAEEDNTREYRNGAGSRKYWFQRRKEKKRNRRELRIRRK